MTPAPQRTSSTGSPATEAERTIASTDPVAVAGDVAATKADLAAALAVRGLPYYEHAEKVGAAAAAFRDALLAATCSCCGRRWTLRTIAGRIPAAERFYWRQGDRSVAHTTIARLGGIRYGEQVRPHEAERIARAMVALEW